MIAIGTAVFTIMEAVDVIGDSSAYLRSFIFTNFGVTLFYLGVYCSVICYFL